MDTGWVTFDSPIEITVLEHTGVLRIDLHRIDGAQYTISYVTEASDGTAVNNIDYQFTPTISEWPHLDTVPLSIEVNIIDNNDIDGNRSFDLQLFAANPLSLVNPNENTITVTIIDDEGDVIFSNGFEN